MSKAQAKVYNEMRAELDARKRVLQAEKDTLLKAPARIAEIDEELAVLSAEDEAYNSKRAVLIPDNGPKS